SPATEPAVSEPQPAVPPHVDMHGRRLMVLFFDLSSMQPEESDRAAATAHAYIDDRLAPADLVAVASFSTSLARRPGLYRRSCAINRGDRSLRHSKWSGARGRRHGRRRGYAGHWCGLHTG